MLLSEFDPDRLLIATSAFQAGERAVASGDTFDWRAAGCSEIDARTLFGVGLLTYADAVTAPVPALKSKQKPAAR